MEELKKDVHEHDVHEHHVEGLGCTCGHCHEHTEKVTEKSKSVLSEFKGEIFKIALSVALFLCALFVANQTAELIMFILSAIVCGYELVINTFKALKKGDVFNEMTLMLTATVLAFVLGEKFEGALIVILYFLGELLEGIATTNSKNKIAGLSNLKTRIVHVFDSSGKKDVAPEDVPIGSLIEVKKGEMVPIDGVLFASDGEFDTKAVTGESKICFIESNQNVYSGSINVGETVVIKTVKNYSDSTVEKIVSAVEGSLSKKAKSQKFITSFSKIYTPVVFAVALLISVIPPLFDSMNFSKWIYKGLSFLVISCPCALVISVPLAFFIGIGALAKNGVLVKGSAYLERLASTQTVVFDKTGTLTYGNFVIDKVVSESEYSTDEITALACVLETKSSHPISGAFLDCKNTGKSMQVEDFKEVSGKGLVGRVDGKTVCVGNEKLVGEDLVKQEEDYPGTVLYLKVDDNIVGKIYILDKIKPEAKQSVINLKKLGVTKTIVLSGDKKNIADIVGNSVGVDQVVSELLPEQKSERLKKIVDNSSKTTVYVGDGINDSPSIAVADVGIAMGGIGSDVAIDTADVVILDDNLNKIPLSVKHSKKTKATVLQNIIGSLTVKFAIMILSVFIRLPVWVSMIADVGVMLLAVLNSLRCSKI